MLHSENGIYGQNFFKIAKSQKNLYFTRSRRAAEFFNLFAQQLSRTDINIFCDCGGLKLFELQRPQSQTEKILFIFNELQGLILY